MMKSKLLISTLSLAVALPIVLNSTGGQASGPAANLPPAKCQKDFNSFEAWREDFRLEAMKAGVSKETWNKALPQIIPDEEVLRRDGKQGGFYVSFLKFSSQRAPPRLARARGLLAKHAVLYKNIEATYGVPGEILLALWGMETDFSLATIAGATPFPIISSMTTLAYDCRRSALFRDNLKSALLLVEKKEVALENMIGQWAGEMSGLQLTPSNYLQLAVDFDKDGKRDIVNNTADLMASAANMLKTYGWKAKQPYLVEVKVPETMDWQKADLTQVQMYPSATWTKEGVTLANGAPLPANLPNGSLMLPMGRLGPAFIAFDNFKTLMLWNASLNNGLTIGYLALRTANAKLAPMRPGNGEPEVLTAVSLKKLQTILQKKYGYDMGKIDGFLGTKTRAVTKEMQIKLGLPADGYPTTELINKL